MSRMRQHLDFLASSFPDHKITSFLLEYGRDYMIGPKTFSGPRGEPKNCFGNATHLAIDNPALTYVEGKVLIVAGIPIEHAWCVTKDGTVVDPTLGAPDGSPTDKISDYFGVPFRTDYVRKAALANGTYGLLDIMSAPLTIEKLMELGLEAGQQWLLDQKKPLRRKRRTR